MKRPLTVHFGKEMPMLELRVFDLLCVFFRALSALMAQPLERRFISYVGQGNVSWGNTQ